MNPILAGSPPRPLVTTRPSPVVAPVRPMPPMPPMRPMPSVRPQPTSFRRGPPSTFRRSTYRSPSAYDLTFERITENVKLIFILGVFALILVVILISSIAKAIAGFKNTQEETDT